MNDGDKAFMVEMEKYCSAETQRLCQIIREMEKQEMFLQGAGQLLQSNNTKLRAALEFTLGNIGCIQDGSSTQRWKRRVETALEEE